MANPLCLSLPLLLCVRVTLTVRCPSMLKRRLGLHFSLRPPSPLAWSASLPLGLATALPPPLPISRRYANCKLAYSPNEYEMKLSFTTRIVGIRRGHFGVSHAHETASK